MNNEEIPYMLLSLYIFGSLIGQGPILQCIGERSALYMNRCLFWRLGMYMLPRPSAAIVIFPYLWMYLRVVPSQTMFAPAQYGCRPL
jgi:hypothetical protein